jgi:hypothetical protein
VTCAGKFERRGDMEVPSKSTCHCTFFVCKQPQNVHIGVCGKRKSRQDAINGKFKVNVMLFDDKT